MNARSKKALHFSLSVFNFLLNFGGYMDKVKFLLFLGFALLAACSSENSVSTSADSVYSSWPTRFSILINEKNSTFTINYVFTENACLLNEGTTQWTVRTFDFPLESHYEFHGDSLVYYLVDEETGNDTNVFIGQNNGSILGKWSYTDGSGNTAFITKDSIFSTDYDDSENVVIESQIDLASSYFAYNLFYCKTREGLCPFSHSDFVNDAPDFINSLISDKNIEILKKTDRTMQFSMDGKIYDVVVEHVQVYNMNNGNSYKSAYVASEGDTCRFEHNNQYITQKYCVDGNYDILYEDAIEEDDGNTYAYSYFKDNSVSFATCVKAMMQK